MHPSATATRRTWIISGIALLALLAALGTGFGTYFQYANQVPAYRPPVVVMPTPNAYTDFLAAGALLPQEDRSRPRREAEWKTPALRKSVAAERKALARLRLGFGREYLNPPILSFRQLLPELAKFRRLGRALLAGGQLAEREGRWSDAVRSYRDCLELGNTVPRGGALIHGLVGLAIQEMGLEGINGVAERLDGPSGARLAREMEALDRESLSFRQLLAQERDFSIACIHEILREENPGATLASIGTFDGEPSDFMEQVAFRVIPRRVMVDGYTRYMDALVEAAGKPYAHQTQAPPLPSDPLGRSLAPTVSAARMKWAYRDVQWRVTRLRLAALAHLRESGRPAAVPGSLVPRYLRTLPQDPFAEEPLVYRVRKGKPLIYSRGPDGDDDQGEHLGKDLQANSQGDITWVGPPAK